MTIYLGVLSALLVLGLVVRDPLATPLIVVGLIGLALLRLVATSRGWVRRHSVAGRASTRRRARQDGVDRGGGL